MAGRLELIAGELPCRQSSQVAGNLVEPRGMPEAGVLAVKRTKSRLQRPFIAFSCLRSYQGESQGQNEQIGGDNGGLDLPHSSRAVVATWPAGAAVDFGRGYPRT